MANELKTYGDLKKLIQGISRQQKGEKILSKGKEISLDILIGWIPYASAAKNTYGFMQAAMSKPDGNKKTDTWLDKLDIDDDMSKIVDDTVENGFMQIMAKTIEGESDTKPLEQDFNMNAKMVDYLKTHYGGRTVAGIKENKIKNKMKKSQLRQIIKEEISRIIEAEVAPAATAPTQPAVKQTAASTAYQKTAQKATSVTSKAAQIKSINDLPGVFEVWFSSLGLKGQAGVSQTAILSKIRDTLTKMEIK
jgi:hypothetical protein